MPGDKDQKPTNPLSAMINNRSLSAMPGGAQQTRSPYFVQGNGQQQQQQLGGIQPSFDHAAPIRRHNLTLPSTGQVLVPNTSSPDATFRSLNGGGGGFISPNLMNAPQTTLLDATPMGSNNSYSMPVQQPWDFTQFQPQQSFGRPSPSDFLSAMSAPLQTPPVQNLGQSSSSYNQLRRNDGPPPRKRLTRITDDADSPLPSGASTPGSTSAFLNDGVDRVQIRSQATSASGTPPPLPFQTNGDGDSSPPVLGPGQKKRARAIIEDDESQSTPQARQSTVIDLSQTSPAPYNPADDFQRFKKCFAGIPEGRVRSVWKQTNGDVKAATAILSSNPILAMGPLPPRQNTGQRQPFQDPNQRQAFINPQMHHSQPNFLANANAQQFYGQPARHPAMPVVQMRTIRAHPIPQPQNGQQHRPYPQQYPPQPHLQQQQHYPHHQQPPKPRMQESKLVASHRPAQAPLETLVAKKRKNLDSDEEDDGRWSDNSNNNFEDESGPDPEVIAEAVNFFNTCEPQEILDYTACQLDAAKLIVAMRPFADEDDIRNKLKETKGISNKLFDALMEVLQAYREIDKVFAQCVRYGQTLSRIMKIWSGGKPANGNLKLPTGQNLSAPASASGSRTASPEPDTGVHMAHLDEEALEQSQQATAGSDIKEAFQDYIRKQPALVPSTVKLKGYQMLGINWLNLLYNKRLSCILADDMGLGKTCQVISFLAHLKEMEKPGPHLIIVPSSTLDNWLREFDTFAPGLKVYSYYGTQANRAELRHDLKREKDIDVIVTTYNMAAGGHDDKKFLKKMEFQTCTYDEGHQLKNSNSKKYRDLMEINVKWRLLLTGTPLQNNLIELVSLLSFILPDIFRGAQDSLQAIFKVPSDAQANMLSRRRIESAKSVMTPFVLRRKKLQVLQELPKKVERIEYCAMTQAQKHIYREALRKSKKVILVEKADTEASEADNEGKGKGKAKAKRGKKAAPPPKQIDTSSNILMELRKAACHPMLFRRLYDEATLQSMARDCMKEMEFADRDQTYILEDMQIMTDFELHRFVQPYKHLKKYGLTGEQWMEGGKVEALKRLLPEMRAKGDRVLLFSQFTQVLELLEAVLETLGIRYLKLTGQTSVAERQGLVDEYYADEDITVFLLSTRAGGLGLNLAAANVVIIYDQDFNPHNDRQAEDRAWRIGQTRDVSVVRLIVKNTIEEQMYAMANTKLALDNQVSNATNEAEDPLQEGFESVAEKKIKSTLIGALRAQLEASSDEEDDMPNADVKPPAVVPDNAERSTATHDKMDLVKSEDAQPDSNEAAPKATVESADVEMATEK